MKKTDEFKPIPPFTSYEEEARFWDTHSVADYWDKSDMVKAVYKPAEKKAKKSKRDAVIHVKLSAKMKQRLDRTAKAQASTISALLRLWVSQKLADADAAHAQGVSH